MLLLLLKLYIQGCHPAADDHLDQRDLFVAA